MSRFFVLIFAIFSLGFFFAVSSTPVQAGRTCCEARYLANGAVDPNGCQACREGIETKNNGDSCGASPNCVVCPGNQPIANSCGGGPVDPTPTPPPACSCGSWTPGACGAAGGCPSGQRRVTRSCNPGGCESESKCEADATCFASISSFIETDPSLKGSSPPQHIGGFGGGYCISADRGDVITSGRISARNTAGTTTNGTIAANGQYTISNLDPASNAYTLTYDPQDPNITCTCPAGCVYTGKSAPTTEDLRFFVSPMGSAWYQTVGGDVAAQAPSGIGLRNRIPQTCVEPWCQPYLSMSFSPTQLQNVGALIGTQGGGVDIRDEAGTQDYYIGPAGINRLVRLKTSLTCRENYDYFYRLYSMGTSPSIDFTNPANALKPDGLPANGKPAYYYQGNLPLTIDSPWVLSGNESMVVFVNGNLVIKKPIKVFPGAFLAFVVSGTITVDPSVGTNDYTSRDGQVQGVFIANSTIVISSAGASGTDLKFVGEGVFATCGNIRLPRDFKNGGNGLQNNKVPTALFLYRPDLVQNTPARMKDSRINWQEVAP